MRVVCNRKSMGKGSPLPGGAGIALSQVWKDEARWRLLKSEPCDARWFGHTGLHERFSPQSFCASPSRPRFPLPGSALWS